MAEQQILDLREEAERLAAAALAAASYALREVGAGRLVDAVRNPSPQLALKVARGVNDVAGGVAAILRALQPEPPRRPASVTGAPRRRDSGPTWRAATRSGEPVVPALPEGTDVWRAATRAPA
jgi:hypothetical protein